MLRCYLCGHEKTTHGPWSGWNGTDCCYARCTCHAFEHPVRGTMWAALAWAIRFVWGRARAR